MNIERGRTADLPAALNLLRRCGLPAEGLADHTGTLLVARSGDRLVGTAALEVYDDGVLLRSVAVDTEWRGRGLGRALTETALDLARERAAEHVFLLTETAPAFFARYDFRTVTREEVPRGVKQSVEFTSACPSSARVMALAL